MSNNRIMIVEDEEIVAADIRLSVEKRGYAVCATASSGLEAIQKAESTRPDLILMDIQLKGNMDGIETATRIKELYQIPVIYLTAFGEDAVLQRSKIAEPYGYITKPFVDRDLHIAIEISIYKKQAETRIKKMEHWLATVLKSIGDGVIASDKDQQITFMNAVAERLTGWSQKDALGKKLTEILNIKDQDLGDLEKYLVQKVITEGLVINLIEDRLLIGKNGLEIPISDSVAPIKGDNGETPGSVLIFRDITESKKSEEALRESEERYRSIFENAVEGLFLSTPEGRFINVNPSFARMLGYASPEELVSSISDIANQYYINDEDWHQYEQLLQTAGFVESFECRVRCKDGSHIWISDSTRVIYDRHGKVVRYEGYVTDITARKRAEEENTRLETQSRQAQKMEAIGTLAGGIAHDFNNILFPIVGYAEMLLEDVSEDSPLRESLKAIYTGSLRARDLVHQILAFSRQETNVLKLMRMQPIIKEALKLIRSTIPTTISINQNLQPNCGAVKADPTQIHQIIMNLTTNAYHAMEKNGGELKITLKEIKLGDHELISPEMKPGSYACLTIADTGMGMSKDVIDKIFDPFFTTKEKGKGTGMGLSVVHGIVKSMNGEIQVHSEPRNGTEFHIFLPTVKTASIKEQTQKNEPLHGGTERVLLVDDEESIITMEKLALERLGYQVTSRTSSIEALEAFRANPEKFDLIITDIAMPKMPGDKLAVELIKIRPDIPVLLCTGFSEAMTEEKIKALGIKDLLMKPIMIKDLAQKIREVLDKEQ